MENKENNLNVKEVWWRSGLEIFYKVSGYIVIPVVLALILGKALDNYFNTKPWIFLGLTGVAFIVSSYSIVYTVSRYMKSIEKENLWKKKDNKQL